VTPFDSARRPFEINFSDNLLAYWNDSRRSAEEDRHLGAETATHLWILRPVSGDQVGSSRDTAPSCTVFMAYVHNSEYFARRTELPVGDSLEFDVTYLRFVRQRGPAPR